jgi:hypothetical protein
MDIQKKMLFVGGKGREKENKTYLTTSYHKIYLGLFTRENQQGGFTFFTDMCIHYILMKSVLNYCMSEHAKAVPLHTIKALVGRVDIAPTHSRPR